MRIVINIDVPELGPTVEIYRAALDLKLGRILDDDVAELVGASSVIYLLANDPGEGLFRCRRTGGVGFVYPSETSLNTSAGSLPRC